MSTTNHYQPTSGRRGAVPQRTNSIATSCIENKFYVDEIYQTGNYVYFFFKTRRTDYRVVKYDFISETFKEVSGELPNRSFIKYTACMDDRAVMAIIATHLFESLGVQGPALMGAFFGLLGALTITYYRRLNAKS